MKTDLFSRAGDAQARSSEASLRPAVARLFFETRAKAGVKAAASSEAKSGRFELVSKPLKRSSDFSRALATCVLALYPAIASAAVIIAGLLLSGGTATS
ncbi:MAG TPA: hypothetical protein VMF90_04315 [Rhizobiaceae bacterium]|nr:hypothetical protein [Rhizobiaceae bacterium]